MSKDEQCWFAVRVTYSREMVLKKYLDRFGIENFVPMCYSEASVRNQRGRVLVPVIHNLVFIRCSRAELIRIKTETEGRLPVRYILDRETHQPLIIPSKQMQDFIAVAGTLDEQLIYLDPTETSLKKGDKVRITGGLFAGVEGVMMRIRGDRRIVVAVTGMMAVATAFIHPSLLEKI